MELLECVLLHLNLIVILKKKKKPLLVSNFASYVEILEILFKKKSSRKKQTLADRSWLS